MRPLILLALLFSTMFPAVADGPTGDLTLTLSVHDVRNNKGVIGVLVFTSAKGWPNDASTAFKAVAVPAEPDVTQLSIQLPAGRYAVVVLHDENKNMKLDRNFIGIPREQWGMSRNPKAILSAPAFEEAQFQFFANEDMEIELR